MSIGNRQMVTLFLIGALSIALSPALLPSLFPRSSATSGETLYPDLRTSTSCGYGFTASIPSAGDIIYHPSTYTASFCMSANETLTLTNSTLAMDLDGEFTES